MTKETDKPIIGKAAIESLSIAMYDAPFFIYREYVQNGADSIDHCVMQRVFKKRSEGQINIKIDSNKRQIIVEDNGIGIESKLVRPYLGNIAQSTKSKYQDKGFRGIGRLGGLAYCDKLTYETSFKGESFKSIMIWDAKNLRFILDSPEIKRDASEVVSIVTDFKRIHADPESHYMKVILDGVSNDDLLNLTKVKDYLSMVAPLPFDSNFSFSPKICEQAKIEKVEIDEYKVFLNGDQLFKGYKDIIYKVFKKNNKESIEKYDIVYDIKFFKDSFEKGLLYWGWYGITKNMKYIPEVNNEKYIRLRKNNIQIGLKSRLDEFHKKESGSQYFIGEVYAVHRELHPNARRDFFIENSVLTAFSNSLERQFEYLHTLFYDFSKKNSSVSIIKSAELANEKLKSAIEKKVGNAKISDLRNDVKRKNNKVLNAQLVLLDLFNKYKRDALGRVIKDDFSIKQLEIEIKSALATPDKSSKEPLDDILGEEEQKLLSFVINVVKSTYAKKSANKFIEKLKNEIQNNYL